MKKMKVIRKDSLYQFGFGTDEMMNLTVCVYCHSLEPSNNTFCSKCGLRLSRANLYDLYKSYHKNCPECGKVLSPSMHYCPHCGIRVKVTPELCAL